MTFCDIALEIEKSNLELAIDLCHIELRVRRLVVFLEQVLEDVEDKESPDYVQAEKLLSEVRECL